MADNSLDFYIRQDYQELTNSPVISNDNLRTWVYFDALNQGGGSVLPNTVDANGAPVRGSFTGSRYITYDPAFGKMRIDKELLSEQNSDLDGAYQDFFEHALTDCLANGYDSLMAVFASHGGGFAGFGGDENTRLLRSMHSPNNRNLLSSNRNITSAIKTALGNVGGPSKLEVIGFDACLMQAVGAADDYMDIAEYILASEAVEPGHGWAYEYLTKAPSALGLARDVVDTFLTETQGGRSHKTPKQLSIVDTVKFQTFIAAFEKFSDELLGRLEDGDRSLHAFVSRSRASAVAFEGIADSVGTNNPSALDLGSWMEIMAELCNPDSAILLGQLLQNARTAYTDMIVEQGVGPGTAAGTGMHITWPEQGEYADNKGFWNQVLFNNPSYATVITPHFSAFLDWFLKSGSPSSGIDEARNSVCGQRAETETGSVDDTRPNTPTSLIQFDSGSTNSETGFFDVDATISLDVSQMLVEFGIDLSTPFEAVLEEKGFEPADEDYLFLLGGDVAGQYERSNFTASWDQNFYFLNISGSNSFEALYVKDEGDGSKTIPTMFFPEEKRENVANLQYLDFLFFDFDFWKDQGASYGFLKFSVDEADGRVNDNLALYINSDSGTLSEQPRSAGGFLMPLVQIDAFVQERKLTTLPGGFNQTIIAWSPNLDYNVLTTPAKNIFNVIPTAGAVVMAMYAYNNGNPGSEPDVRYYNVTDPKDAASQEASITQVPPPSAANSGNSTTEANTVNGETQSSALNETVSDTMTNQTVGNGTTATGMPGNGSSPNNIFDHSVGVDDGTVTDDSNEMKDDNPANSTGDGGDVQAEGNQATNDPTSDNDKNVTGESSSATRGLPWLLLCFTIAVYAVL